MYSFEPADRMHVAKKKFGPERRDQTRVQASVSPASRRLGRSRRRSDSGLDTVRTPDPAFKAGFRGPWGMMPAMKLRHSADVRTLVWAFGLFPAVALVQYVRPELAGWLLPLGLYVGFSAGVFSHNQNHCPTFTSRRANSIYAAWISFFYGYPTFAWIPTHNLNHHKFVDRAGDATITWRYSKNNTWFVASTYFFVSAYFQSDPIKEYIAKARASKPDLFRQVVLQYSVVLLGHAAMVALAVSLHGPKTGAFVYISAFLLPALFGLWSMMFINYVQHVHCDPWSKHNHSRNFVSKVSNWLVFNNGLHAAHHENAGLHWSKLPEAHAKIASFIDPALLRSSIFGYCFKVYLLGIFFPQFRTKQIGRPAYDPPDGEVSLATASVQAAHAGVNAQMIS
jgi:beta-carotene hydroxylase